MRCFAAVCLLGLSMQAMSHTPYLLPADFEVPRSGWVSLEASFADTFFVPEVAFNNDGYQVIAPDGRPHSPDTLFTGRVRTLVEHQLQQEGTWRFSTGQRYGAEFRTYLLNGRRGSVRDPNQPLPAGAEPLAHFQAVTLAEAYVSLGQPNERALQPHGQGLELVFQTHPNSLFAAEPIQLQLLFDGKPLPEQVVRVFAAGSDDDSPAELELESDALGSLRFQLQQPGRYLLLSRYRHPAPVTASVPEYSYSYSVVIDVTH